MMQLDRFAGGLRISRGKIEVTVLTIVLAAMLSLIVFDSGITGRVTYNQDLVLELNATYQNSSIENISLPDNLNTVWVSGLIQGQGNAKVYLESNSTRMLVIGTSSIGIQDIKNNLVTGYVADEAGVDNSTGAENNPVSVPVAELQEEDNSSAANTTGNERPENAELSSQNTTQDIETTEEPISQGKEQEYREFVKYCAETCEMNNITGPYRLIIDITGDATLRLLYIDYTYAKTEPAGATNSSAPESKVENASLPEATAPLVNNITNITASPSAKNKARQAKPFIDKNIEKSLANDRGSKAKVIIRYNESLRGVNARKFEAKKIDYSELQNLSNSQAVTGIYPNQPVGLLISQSSEIIRLSQAVEYYNSTYSLPLGGSGVKICVIDTGVNPAIVPNTVSGYNVQTDTSNYLDDNGHGTETAYIIYRIAPDSQIVAVKALDALGNGYESDILSGLLFCQDSNASIISLSIGAGAYDGYCDDNPVAQKVDELSSLGILVVAATGNDGGSLVKSPACARSALAVAASTKSDILAQLSSYNNATLLVAPGENIVTLDQNNNVVQVSGTSMSAPFASAAAALVLQADSSLYPPELAGRLVHTGQLINNSLRYFSRLDIYNALLDNVTNDLQPNSDLGSGNDTTYEILAVHLASVVMRLPSSETTIYVNRTFTMTCNTTTAGGTGGTASLMKWLYNYTGQAAFVQIPTTASGTLNMTGTTNPYKYTFLKERGANVTARGPDSYTVECWANDTYTRAGFYSSTVVINVLPIPPPYVNISSPQDSEWETGNFTLTYGADNLTTLANMSARILYIMNGTTPWVARANLTAGIEKTVNITVGNGYYCNVEGTNTCGVRIWANDTSNRINQTEYNFSIDYTRPAVHLISPSDNSSTDTGIAVSFACNITDNLAIKNLTLLIWNSSSDQIYANTTDLDGTVNSTSWNYSFESAGAYKWNCAGFDLAENNNQSSESNYTITISSSYAPNVTTPLIIPDSAYANDSLNCSFMATDLGDNNTLTATVIWFQNREYNGTFNVSKVAPNGTTAFTDVLVTPLTKGDNWTCSVEIWDGVAYSGYTNSSELTISNSAPNVTTPIIIPNPVYANDSLNCSFVAADADAGDTLTATIIWFKNAAYNKTFNVSKTVTASATSFTDKLVTPLTEGDNWTCSAEVRDGTASSDFKNSSVVMVAISVPLWSNANASSFYPHETEIVRLSASWTELYNLSHCWLSTNETGVWANYSPRDASDLIDDFTRASWEYGDDSGSNLTLANTVVDGGVIGQGLSLDYNFTASNDWFRIDNYDLPNWPTPFWDITGYKSVVIYAKADVANTHQIKIRFYNGTKLCDPSTGYQNLVTTNWERKEFNISSYSADCIVNATRITVMVNDITNSYAGSGSILLDELYIRKGTTTSANSTFNWRNESLKPGTVVSWRIYCNSSSGNINSTDIMNLTIQGYPADAAAAVKQESGDLIDELITSIYNKTIPENTGAYAYPDRRERDIMVNAFYLMQQGNLAQAAINASAVNYTVVNFTDAGTGLYYYVLMENLTWGGDNLYGWGTYIYFPGPGASNLAVQAPHIPSDQNTWWVAGKAFKDTRANTFYMAGADRDTNPSSTASPTASLNPYTVYNEITLNSTNSATHLFEIHGFSVSNEPGYPNLTMSSGNTTPLEIIQTFCDRVREESFTCGIYNGTAYQELAAQRDLQCMGIRSAGGLCIHAELEFFIRNSSALSMMLVEAINETWRVPFITIYSPANGSALQSGSFTLNASIDFIHGGMWWMADSNGSVYTACGNCSSFTAALASLSSGEHNITVWANDSANNQNRLTTFFTVSGIAPPAFSNALESDSLPHQTGVVSLSAEWQDNNSVEYCWLSTNESGNWVNYTARESGELIDDFATINWNYGSDSDSGLDTGVTITESGYQRQAMNITYTYTSSNDWFRYDHDDGPGWPATRWDSTQYQSIVVYAKADVANTHQIKVRLYTGEDYCDGTYANLTGTDWQRNEFLVSGFGSGCNLTNISKISILFNDKTNSYSGTGTILVDEIYWRYNTSTLVNSTFHWMNETVQPGSFVSWRIYCNNTLGLVNYTNARNLTVQQYIPDASAVPLAESGDFMADLIGPLNESLIQRYSGGYVRPNRREREIMVYTFDLMKRGILAQAAINASAVNYSVVNFTDTSTGLYYYVLRENLTGITTNRYGWGSYIYYPGIRASNLVIQAPHPLFDYNTWKIASIAFETTKADSLYIAGAHRFSDANGIAEITDRLNAYNVFLAITQNATTSATHLLALHGFAIANHPGYPNVTLSNGDGAMPGILRQFCTSLGYEGFTCGIYNVTDYGELAAAWDIECIDIRSKGGTCVHPEAEYFIRSSQTNYMKFVNAINNTWHVPLITFRYPQNGSTITNATFTLNASIDLAYGGIWWALDSNGTINIACNNCSEFNASIAALSLGKHNITVWANDSANNQNYGFSEFFVGTRPVITAPAVIPATAYSNDSLNCSFMGADGDANDTLTATIVWFQNGVYNSTFNVSKTVANNATSYTNMLVTPLTAGDNWTCSAEISDGALLSGFANSTAVLISSTVLNTNPAITSIQPLAGQDPIEAGQKVIAVNFTVNDPDGNQTINISQVNVAANLSGTTRSASQCSMTEINSSAINVSCNLTMQYYDRPGAWSLNISVWDTSEGYSENTTESLTYNELSAICLDVNSVSFGALLVGDQGKAAGPLVINNTGNSNFTRVSVTGVDLANGSSVILATAFSVNASNSSAGHVMSNNSQINISGSALGYDSDSQKVNLTLYIYASIPAAPLMPGLYSSLNSWVITPFK